MRPHPEGSLEGTEEDIQTNPPLLIATETSHNS